MRRPLPLALTPLLALIEQQGWQRNCVGCLRPSPSQPCRSCELECRASAKRRWHVSVAPELAPLASLYYFGCYSSPGSNGITAMASALRRFKYAGDRSCGHALRKLLERNARILPQAFDAIVPVPVHRARLIRRGFNQSAWLARGVASGLCLPLIADALQRCDDGPAQASLGGRERRRHGRQMFRLGAARLAARRLLLVDDVLTTATTLRSAAAVLCSGNPAASVNAVVLLVADPRLSAAAAAAGRDDEQRGSPTLGRQAPRR